MTVENYEDVVDGDMRSARDAGQLAGRLTWHRRFLIYLPVHIKQRRILFVCGIPLSLTWLSEDVEVNAVIRLCIL